MDLYSIVVVVSAIVGVVSAIVGVISGISVIVSFCKDRNQLRIKLEWNRDTQRVYGPERCIFLTLKKLGKNPITVKDIYLELNNKRIDIKNIIPYDVIIQSGHSHKFEIDQIELEKKYPENIGEIKVIIIDDDNKKYSKKIA